VRRGRRFRYVGWAGALLSVAAVAEKGLVPLLSNRAGVLVGIGFGVSLLLVNWTRIWVRESREPFKYTYSVAELEPGPEVTAGGPNSLAEGPIRWLARDLREKLGDRVSRLSLLEEDDVPKHEEGGEPAPHVHISGWYGVRPTEDGEWCIEVVPKVRVGGKGAPAELGSTVRFKLDDPAGAGRYRRLPPTLDVQQYRLLLERVYWAVASKIYAEIRTCVEQKALLLPPGRLRAAAYLNEANDYARSNTLDAFAAARDLYRKAQETYDRAAHRRPTTPWRQFVKAFWRRWDDAWSSVRGGLSQVFRRFGRREVLAAEAQLGYARMLVAEWNLRVLCGVAAKEIYEAPWNITEAVKRLKALPADIPDRDNALFRAYVTLGLADSDLQDPTGATTALRRAAELKPTEAAESADFVIAEAAIASDPIRSLRLLTRAVERDPKHERAHFMKAQELERLWRRRASYEPLLADSLDEEYAEVIAIDPGNVSAWANRGYIGWLVSPPDPAKDRAEPEGARGQGRRPGRRQRALAALDAGCRYKEVRRDAMVGELNWNLARFQAEAGEFGEAYKSYIAAVSAMLGEPRMGFVEYFYRDATKALLRRYGSYEKRVREQAKVARPKEDGRMVDSVLAFVLNDCGGARYSYYRRSGDAAQLHRAVALFMSAIHKNPSFVLPRFNLAELAGARAADKTMDGGDRAVYLNTALQCLAEVIELERFWTFPRLQMARLEALLPTLESEFSAQPAISAEPHAWLQCLLPHRSFRSNGLPGGRIDATGEYVARLLGDQEIWWDTDFNEVQVKVLIRWASTLARPAPEQALALCTKLQKAFYPSHPLLLESKIAAATLLLANPTSQEHAMRLDREIKKCESLQATLVFADLQLDPANHEKLDSSFEQLSRKQKLEIRSRAPSASPSDQVISLLEGSRQGSNGTGPG
jgi:tetratricopeptide (TPR) repeat protein